MVTVTAEEIQLAIERFLNQSAGPVLAEPGQELMPLTAANVTLQVRKGSLWIQAWTDQRNVHRRILRIEAQKRSRLDLSVERYAVHPATETDDSGQADLDAVAVHALLRRLEQQNEVRFHEFLEEIRTERLASVNEIFRQFPE